MTDEKDILRELKKTTIKELRSTDVRKHNLQATDQRLPKYIERCISKPDEHNLYELLAIKRFLAFLDKYDFSPKHVKAFIYVYENLKFSGTEGPTRYRLTPIQVFQIANMKGFYRSKDKRLILDSLLFVPRKFAKTTQVAAFAVEDLLFGDANAQAYVAANSYNQAQICFGEIKAVLKRMDRKFKRFKINREKVYNLSPLKTSFAECLASNPENLDGLNASTVIVDEYAQANSADLKNVLTSSMGARLNPSTIVITTASDKRDGPFMDLLVYYKKVLRGEIEDDSIFAHIFEPDVDDEEGDVKTWRKVQPHMGITVYEDFYHAQWRKAQISAPDMKEFRNKLLNIFTKNEAKTWIDRKDIEELHYKHPSLNSSRCVVTVDLSVSDDFSAITYLFYLSGRVRNNVECPFHSITEYFIPEDILGTHPNRELYKKWVEQGHLKTIKGRVIDYEYLSNHILEKPYIIRGLGFDPYKSKDFVKIFEGAGQKDFLYPIKQTYGEFTSYVEAMEIAVFNKQMTFDPNPITAYCFGNAVIDEDRLENRKPIKESENKKIDGAITNVMGFWMMHNIKNTI